MQDELEKSKQKLKNVLAEVVKKHRLEQEKSINRISNEIALPKSMWLDLEKGIKDPQLTTIWRVSEALEIPIENLLTEVKDILGQDFTLID